jgi:transposase
LSRQQLLGLRDFLKSGCPSSPLQECQVTDSREFGAGHAVLEVLKDLGLDKAIYSRRETWVGHVLAMIVGRVVYQGSKLALTNLWRDTVLWSLCGLGDERPDVDDCYAAMDRLLQRQPKIQKTLARKHLKNGCLVLYDITSSYFEGEYKDSDLVAFGYNRDRKKGHKQIVIGLMTSAQGCPVGVSVYRGNTSDQTTVADRVRELKQGYGLRDLIMVGDRGMLTSARLPELSEAGLRSITALTHGQIQQLVKRKVIEVGLFDEKDIAEVYDPDESGVRYMLCRNPMTAERERKTRDALIAKTREALEQLARSRKKRTNEELAAAVGRKISRWKVGKLFRWEVRRRKLTWELNEALLEQERALDGCYVIRTDVDSKTLDKTQTVDCYKGLSVVEGAFRQMKTVLLEIRPTYHHRDDRIEAHVFLCMLAYYIQWHMWRRLAPLFDTDGEGKDRRWTFAGVLERLKAIRRQTVVLQNSEVVVQTTPDDEQQHILDLLSVAM